MTLVTSFHIRNQDPLLMDIRLLHGTFANNMQLYTMFNFLEIAAILWVPR